MCITFPPGLWCLLLTAFYAANVPILHGMRIPTQDDDDVTWSVGSQDYAGADAVNQKVVTKSAISSNDNGLPNKNYFTLEGSANWGKYILSPEAPSIETEVDDRSQMEAKIKRTVSTVKRSHRESFEIEDQVLQNILNVRRDALRFRIRNSSELHVDNHNDTSKEESKGNSKSEKYFVEKLAHLKKPFHFHIPIVEKSGKHKVYVQDKTGGNLNEENGPVRNRQVFKEVQSKGESAPARHNAHLAVRSTDNDNVEFEEMSKDKRAITDNESDLTNVKPESVVPTVTKYDIDQLINQYPQLIPPVNRKRNSGSQYSTQDVVDDAIHYHLFNIPVVAPASKADPEETLKFAPASISIVKNISFSQGFVDSILGHEDDFLQFQSKIKSHASKLGINPEELVQVIVNGNLKALNGSLYKNISEKIQKIQQDFQKLFLDDEHLDQNQGPKDGESVGGDEDAATYSAYMKVLKRNRRSLKNWFKKVFRRGDSSNDDKTTSTTTPPPKSRKSEHQKRKEKAGDERQSKTVNKNVYRMEVDENGDTAVDLLLPIALRRSTYLKNKAEIKRKLQEDGAFEEEYAKSEEKEQVSETQSKRRKRNIDADNEEAVMQLRKINVLSKDEVFLIVEMVLNIVESQCEGVAGGAVTGALENFRAATEMLVENFTLPDYVSVERDSPVQNLFNQLLACSESSVGLKGMIKGTEGQSGTVTMSGDDKPLRRTKRVRREELAENNESSILSSGERHISKANSELDMSEPDSQQTYIPIQSLMKHHFLFYKLARNTCQEYLDRDLLHDFNLIFMTELARLVRQKELNENVQTYLSHEAEKIFDECMAIKLV